ncbi:MAG: molecular chaperone TorD family protein [Nitrospirae bacterium]|nr:molecular chaperone TorD family protein [Nitrospirota bacterium]
MKSSPLPRSNLYGLLSLIYNRELTAETLRELKKPEFRETLSKLNIQLGGDFFNKPEEELLLDLTLEYTRLFIGPGRHISPHESVYREDKEDKGLLWGEATVEVKEIIEGAGLEYKADYKGIPDHISIELEFMQRLTKYEHEAWESGDREKACRCLEYEKLFLESHLDKWVPLFCDKVMEEGKLTFYREMARLTKEYISLEKRYVNELLSDSPKAGQIVD